MKKKENRKNRRKQDKIKHPYIHRMNDVPKKKKEKRKYIILNRKERKKEKFYLKTKKVVSFTIFRKRNLSQKRKKKTK